jgi:uncharacterized membrane protein
MLNAIKERHHSERKWITVISLGIAVFTLIFSAYLIADYRGYLHKNSIDAIGFIMSIVCSIPFAFISFYVGAGICIKIQDKIDS